MLEASGVKLSYGEQQVLKGVTLEVPQGAFTALIGANGCGKTTLLNVLARMLRPEAGEVRLAGQPVTHFSRRELAQRMALLPQRTTSPAGMSVRELVMQGRFPWQSWWQQWSPADQQACDQAIALAGIEPLLDRSLATLSGGQLQRCWIAMTLAQDTPVILLDEPTTFLDIAHQVTLLELLVSLREQGKTIVAVLHDLNQAARYADHLVMVTVSCKPKARRARCSPPPISKRCSTSTPTSSPTPTRACRCVCQPPSPRCVPVRCGWRSEAVHFTAPAAVVRRAGGIAGHGAGAPGLRRQVDSLERGLAGAGGLRALGPGPKHRARLALAALAGGDHGRRQPRPGRYPDAGDRRQPTGRPRHPRHQQWRGAVRGVTTCR